MVDTNTDVSPFARIEDTPPPRLIPPVVRIVLGILFCIAATVAYILGIGIDAPAAQFGVAVLISIIITIIILSLKRQRQRILALFEVLNSLTLELENIRKALEKYLNNLDKGSDRYFTFMTTGETVKRYYLTQIMGSLASRIEKVEKFLVTPDRTNINIAYRYLQAPLRIREGVLDKNAKQMLFPLKEVRRVCREYVAEIEAAIERIEREEAQGKYDVVTFDDYFEDESQVDLGDDD